MENTDYGENKGELFEGGRRPERGRERAHRNRIEWYLCVKMSQQSLFSCMLTKNLVIKKAV